MVRGPIIAPAKADIITTMESKIAFNIQLGGLNREADGQCSSSLSERKA